MSRKKPIVKNRVSAHIEQSVINLTIENPAFGQLRASQELMRQGTNSVIQWCTFYLTTYNDLETLKKLLSKL